MKPEFPNVAILKVGESGKVSISFLPGTGIDQGLHIFYLTVTSTNYPTTDIGLYPTVTASGIGNALFKISDIYTGTFVRFLWTTAVLSSKFF